MRHRLLLKVGDNMNNFLQSKGQKERVYKTDMSDIYAKNVMVNIMPEDLIPTGRKGKRLRIVGKHEGGGRLLLVLAVRVGD